MNVFHRRVLNIALILILLFSSGGYMLLHLSLQALFKEIAEEKLTLSSKENNAETVVVFKQSVKSGESDFRFLSAGEFVLNDSIYDIISYEEDAEKYVLLCINDKNEGALEKFITRLIRENLGHSAANKSSRKSLESSLTDALLPSSTDEKSLNDEQQFASLKTKKYTNFKPDLTTPPPKV